MPGEYDGFTAHEPDNLYMEVDPGYGCGSVGFFLKSAIDAETEQTELHLCEANAKAYYAGIRVLEYLAHGMREQYKQWQLNDFQKPNDR